MSEKINVPALLASVDIIEVASRYLTLKKEGNEFVSCCCFHSEKTPSLKFSRQKQIWACFGCGAHENGASALDFVMKYEGIGFLEACERLKNGNGGAGKPVALPPLKKAPPWRSFAPPTDDLPDLDHGQLGAPLKFWVVCDADGHPLVVEARYGALTGAGKETRFWSWGNYSDKDPPRWECKAPSRPRPFFGLEQLARHPSAQVMIHEAPKKAEAGQALFPKLVHLGIIGGVYQVAHMDVAPFAGRRCILLPDNDEAGKQAMSRLAPLLWAAGAAEVKGVDPETLPDGSLSPEGWDIADTTDWTPAIALEWAKARKMDYPAPQQTAQEAFQAPPADEEPPPSDDIPPPARAQPALMVVDGGALRAPRQEIDPEAEQLPAFSEFALAQRFADGPGRDWRYTAVWSEWAKWNGTRWVPDEVKSITFALKNCCTAAMQDYVSQSTPSQRMKLTTLKTVNAVMGLVGSFPGIATAASSWDSDTMLLGTPVGIVDLRTGGMIQAAQAQMISKSTSCAAEPGAHPWWNRVLERATGDVGPFLQRWCGYMLTGDTREERFLFIHGPGGGGKSKFILVLSEILGDYRRTAKMESFTAQSRQEHSEEIARLAGARLVVATETDEGSRWNEARIKALTGRDAIAARHMHRNTFEFKPQFKLVFVGNHRPALRSVGEEMRRRIDLIEWGGSIPQAERILDLPDKLRAEYPAILAWMIEGCLLWQREGLGQPESVAANVRDYIQAEDSLGAWLEACAELGGEYRALSGMAYTSYKRWAENAGEFVPSQKRFTQRLRDRGFETLKSGERYFVGFKLRPVEDADSYVPESARWTPD